MDSGIYRLTYKTGDTYVGKSIHLNVRWHQHFDKLLKGKAAKNMQDAYGASNRELPRTEVLLYCHPDMLDYYEGYFINHLKPELNTTIPQELPEDSKQLLIEHADQDRAQYSIITLIKVIIKCSDEAIEFEKQARINLEEFQTLESDYHELSEAWNSRAVRDCWANQEYRRALAQRDELEREVADLGIEVFQLRSWQRRVEGANWWQRLWRSW